MWKVKSDLSCLEDLTVLAQVLNGRLETKSEDRSSKTLYSAWCDLKAKYPERFTTTDQKLLTWHRHQGELSLEEGQWAAAVFHFDRFLALESQDPSILQLRSKAYQQVSFNRQTDSSGR